MMPAVIRPLIRRAGHRLWMLLLTGVTLFELGVAFEVHLWWFTSLENLLGCSEGAILCRAGAPQSYGIGGAPTADCPAAPAGAPGGTAGVCALSSLTFTVKNGDQGAVIGQAELAQPDKSDTAEKKHVSFTASGKGGVDGLRIRNVAQRRHLELTYVLTPEQQRERRVLPANATRTVTSEQWYLSSGDVIRLNGGEIRVDDVTRDDITLAVTEKGKGGPRRVKFGVRGLSLPAPGAPADAAAAPSHCRILRSFDGVRQWMTALSYVPLIGPRFGGRPERLSIGGNVDCAGPGANHLSLAHLRADALFLVHSGGEFYLAPGTPAGGHAPAVSFQRGASAAGRPAADAATAFSDISWPVEHPRLGRLTALTIGRTTYAIQAEKAITGNQEQGVKVTLTPTFRVNYFNRTGQREDDPADRAAASRQPPPSLETAANVERRFALLHPLRDISVPAFVSSGLPVQQNAGPATPSGGLTTSNIVLRLIIVLLPLCIAVTWAVILSGLQTFGLGRAVVRAAATLAGVRRNTPWSPGRLPRRRSGGRTALIAAGVAATTAIALAPEITLLAGRKTGVPVDFYMLLTIANWFIASAAVILWGGGRLLAPFWIAIVALAAIGNLFLTALGMDGDASHWAAFMLKNKLLFLDLVPPWIVAIALVDPRVLRPSLQRLIGTGEPGALLQVIRWAPLLLLFGGMILWLAIGTQAGVEGFNPVEFGKVAAVVMLASLLVGYDPAELRRLNEVRRAGVRDFVNVIRTGGLGGVLRKRGRILWRAWRRRIVPVLLGGLFVLTTGLLVFVPVAQSDWSPLLIILLQGAIIFSAYFVLSIFPWIRSEWSYALRRRSVPGRFLPVATLYEVEIGALLAASISAAVLFWLGLPALLILIIILAGVGAILALCRFLFGEYAVSNGLALGLLFLSAPLLLALYSALSSLIVISIAAAAIAAGYAAVRMAGWAVRGTRWNRIAATWPVIGIALLLFAGTTGVSLALYKIGIPKEHWVSKPHDDAIKALREDYAKSQRPALIGRFISWFDLDPKGQDDIRYRDFGLQVIRSRAVIAAAPCGADPALTPEERLFRGVMSSAARAGEAVLAVVGFVEHAVAGVATLGDIRNGLCGSPPRAANPAEKPLTRQLYDGNNPMRVPVVQFDFPATFLIARFGLAFAAVLLFVQASVVLLGVAGFLWILRGTADGELDTRVRRFLSIVLLGCTTLVALHWVISWCNILGLLPVMGQPMLWLSAGVSHQILMVFPCIIASIIALRYGAFTALDLRFRMPPR